MKRDRLKALMNALARKAKSDAKSSEYWETRAMLNRLAGVKFNLILRFPSSKYLKARHAALPRELAVQAKFSGFSLPRPRAQGAVHSVPGSRSNGPSGTSKTSKIHPVSSGNRKATNHRKKGRN